MIRCFVIIGLVALAGMPDAVAAETHDFDSEIRPLLQKLCVDCHGPDTQKGDLRIDTLDPDFIEGADVETWHDALDQLHLGDMPPTKAEVQPTGEEVGILSAWLNAGLKAAAETRRLAGGRNATRRLTSYEYANTMRDLLGIDYDYARELPPEAASPEGFLNNGATLEMSPSQIETCLAVARRALDIAIVEGERPVVHHVEAEATAVGKLPRKNDGGAIPVNPEFVLDVVEFPRSGEFEVVVEAGAVVPEGHDFPRLRVSLGCVPGIIHVPRKLVGEADVTAPPEQPQRFVFRGRMEDYPQAGEQRFGANVDFNGIIVLIDFLDADGRELRYPHRTYSDPPPKPKKGEPAPAKAVEPEEPLLDIVIRSVSYRAPVITHWPPTSHVELLGGESAVDGDRADDRQRAAEALRRFMPRAFRRPVGEDEVATMLGLYDAVRETTASYEAVMREVFSAVLVSPHFLHLVAGGDDHALASRLSYFLWSTMPDARLTALADYGWLSDPEVLAGEVERLLNDERCAAFVEHFADQWFDLGGLDRVAVNPEFFPDFDNDLKAAMRTEAREVFGEILRGDLSCLELIDSNWTMTNRALARHYGLAETPRSGAFERVTLSAEDRRGGVFGQGAFLLANSNGEHSHPIKRAVWVLDRLLDSPPAPPPPDVPELDAESPDLANLTVKEQLAVHRDKTSCRQCHENIDPWGLAMERFDATGLFRSHAPVRRQGKAKANGGDAALGAALDPVTELPDGVVLEGVDDLKRYLLSERRQHFARSVVRRLASYALGRSLELGDREAIESLTEEFVADGFRLRGLIVALVDSELFREP